jgi:hypothetical protein
LGGYSGIFFLLRNMENQAALRVIDADALIVHGQQILLTEAAQHLGLQIKAVNEQVGGLLGFGF